MVRELTFCRSRMAFEWGKRFCNAMRPYSPREEGKNISWCGVIFLKGHTQEATRMGSQASLGITSSFRVVRLYAAKEEQRE
jgi:hypothetical protein